MRAESENLKERARAAHARSHRLADEGARITRLFETLLADFYQSATVSPSGVAHAVRLSELRSAATEFGRRARVENKAPEAMLVQLKATLAEAAPALRAFERDTIAHQVTHMAIEGYYEL